MSTDNARRLGSAALGMFVGLVLGFVTAIAAFTVLELDPSLPRFVFGGAAIGFLAGLVCPEPVWHVAEASTHYFLGLAAARSSTPIEPNQDAPKHLKVAFWAGSATLIVLSLFLIWW